MVTRHKNMEYTIVTETHANALSKTVNEYIELGWKPQGGVSMIRISYSEGGSSYTFAQALIKENVKEPII